MDGHAITMLGTGLIGDFYTNTLHGQRGRDEVRVVYSRSAERGAAFRERWDIAEVDDRPGGRDRPSRTPTSSSSALPELPARGGRRARGQGGQGRAVHEAARPDRRGGAPDARDGRGRRASSAATSRTCATRPRRSRRSPSVGAGAIGDVTWVRSRETHPGPHSAWFWDGRLTGGGAIIDLGCHCIEIIRNFVGKGNRPVEVLCHTDTLVHPIADEDNAIALIRFESGAIGQFEVSWTFRGGMDLRDEVAGTHGTIWLNHFLRTGFEMFSAPGAGGGYVAEKAETSSGWLFPVGDEVSELGYVDMFSDMFRAIDEGGTPQETFYDGYVVNAIMDAATARRRRTPGSRSSSSGAAGRRRASPRPRRRFDGPGRHQARDPARRPPQAHPQGPGDRRLQRPRGRRRLSGSRCT